mmetsp:Transcript_25710/g.56021  ORF Transcript_25710/g.56021 Transcript_25710/m.56021 type:complete len:319 (+) Transcript_25710:108-1064(+)|eukprot:CAMPEP_0202917648 /NCGR_PEP_ID=MMETSP1392-20130828/71511_1 /ASSEMBLY_ACC=CAM_ASM_000868 /TAXON_ID=225041 /ORGANISM="Chlamydomonas chlamydogama, Strain SAG 11-48b" /LENGTH=318 /DNA_ID=CAMNT_0049610465 /DNA_START=106 /DNA_END=1062 /DNA_ORIENTATION=-
MRFKATFTERGLHILEKGFLPTFEKFGKSVQVLLGPDEVHFIQTSVNTDGCHVTARFALEVLFETSTYKCQSKHFNLIAFSADVGLLLRVLRGAGTNDADTLEVKLSQKTLPAETAGETRSIPYLTFTGRGANVSMIQDLPVSKPFPGPDIDRLVAAKEVAALCPYYVDLQLATPTLHALVDRMKSLGDNLMFGLAKNGDVHVNVRAVNVLLGSQVLELPVYPQDVRAQHPVDRALPPEQQLEQAREAAEAEAVHVHLKHMSRALNVSQLTTPSQILCGIAGDRTYVHMMYVFRDPTKDLGYDDTVHLSFRLPVKDEA